MGRTTIGAIMDIRGQVQKAMQEMDMFYGPGMEFRLDELNTSRACKDKSGYESYIGLLIAEMGKSRKFAVMQRNGVWCGRRRMKVYNY